MNKKNVKVLTFSAALTIAMGMSATVLQSVPVMAEESNGWVEEDGVNYWYEGGVRQGVKYNEDGSIDEAYRGKEIYDPDSDAWYWLDNVQNGAVAKNKDVYQESEAGAWGDIEGEDGKTYGKWVRYDENGHMVKGWQKTETGIYYFDLTYGTMAKGEAVIDGAVYTFNKDTGILESEEPSDDDGISFFIDGWHNVNGTAYWYEGGVRQGVKYNADGSIDASYRGKEIYDPGSDAWYWLDNVQEGAIAKSKDVYQESEAGDWGDIEGEDGKTYGKWVRYDVNGHMVKGWNEQGGNRYYFEPVTGAMVKGVAVVDGTEYNFDENTGVLDVVYNNPDVTITYNISNNSYSTARYDYDNDVIDAYLFENEDGGITRLEYTTTVSWDNEGNYTTNKIILIENYDEQFNLISCSTIPMELELFGGFYSGEEYNWLVFGDYNKEESDDQEVYRVVKYTKTWERVGSCSLYGANTYRPFDAGTCRMSEYQGNLFIRTCHTMYDHGDGLHHQANVTIEVDEEKVEITDSYTIVMNVGYGYVSHSFDQFIDTTDGVLTAVDLGDAYPRSIVLFKYPYKADEKEFTADWYNRVEYVDMLQIPEAAGGGYAYNCTGVSIGGYEVSDSHYLVAYSSVDQSDAANQVSSTAVRDIYIAALPRDGELAEEEAVTFQITDYSEGMGKTPYLVKLTDKKYLLIWEYGDKINYTYIDNTGKRVDEIHSFTGALSECAPIVHDGDVIWYTSSNDYYNEELVFYKLKENGRLFKKVIKN